jgi:predicted kinase
MENSSRILKNLNNDVNQVLASSQNTVIDENDTDLIRRRRLEHLANRTTSSPPTTDTKDDKNDNNA